MKLRLRFRETRHFITKILQDEMGLGRSLEFLDLVADIVGILIGYFIFKRLQRTIIVRFCLGGSLALAYRSAASFSRIFGRALRYNSSRLR